MQTVAVLLAVFSTDLSIATLPQFFASSICNACDHRMGHNVKILSLDITRWYFPPLKTTVKRPPAPN